MGLSESGGVCRDHPNQNPAPGICPNCLRERLSLVLQNRAPSSSAAKSWHSSPYSSSSCSSTPASTSSSFNNRRGRAVRHVRNPSDRMSVFSMPLVLGCDDKNGLRKSRSVAAEPVRRRAAGDEAGDGAKERRANRENKKKNKKKGGGFWKKLLVSTGKKTREVFTNPIAVRGRI